MDLGRLVERIDGEARSLRPGRAALTAVAAPFFAVGWLVGQLFRVVWLIFAWIWTAALVGFRSGRGS